MEQGVLAGRFELDRLVGHGGMGQVWQAHDRALGRTVAVKVMAVPQDETDAGERFLREARAAARLSHPGIVSVYDLGRTEDGRVFIVMELVDGESLAEVLRRRGPLPAETVADIGARTAAALAAAHEAGVIHRDIKPGNLLLKADGTVKVADFGIAVLADDSATNALTRTGVLIGTASYTAPERALGHPAAPASDLYALGCVLYEALAGQPPFQADSIPRLLFQHCYQQPEPITALNPATPPALADAVHRLLAKDPAHRPADARAAGSFLSSTAGPRHTKVLPALPPPEKRGWSARGWRLTMAAGAGTVLLLVAFVAGIIVSHDAAPRAGGATPPAPSAKVTASTTAAPRSTATPSPPRASDLAASLADRLGGQAAPGDERLAKDLRNRLAKLTDRIADGKLDQAADLVRELRQRLADARRQGTWSGDPDTEQLLDRLAALLPSRPAGPQGPPGPGKK